MADSLVIENEAEPVNADIGNASICRTFASKDVWKTLEGSFVLSGRADRVVFFLEGPPPGIDLLIKSVIIHCENDDQVDLVEC